MAVFEKKIPRKVYLDDTQVLTCKFENTQNIQGHTEYIIRVQRGPQTEKSWHIYKRYNDFVSLHNVLQVSGLNLPLPPKKLIGNMEREFIAERQIGLQNYLNYILMNPILASSLPVKKFLDPENYATPSQGIASLESLLYILNFKFLNPEMLNLVPILDIYVEVALQHVSMALRSEVNYEVVKPVPEMGWRLRKHYFQHPNIHPIEFVSCNEVGGFVIRPLHTAGSLRDLLCVAKPKIQFIKKYGNPKQVKPLSASEISSYGRQILEVLKFLNDKGLPFGHLQTGNIILENGKVKLLDIENGVLGLPSYYRPFFVQHKKIQSLESIDVYCFGHVLYEMAFGHPLHESVCDMFPAFCCPPLKCVLESILSSEACKAGLPTLGNLLMHPFFAPSPPAEQATPSTLAERPHLKFSANVKEALKQAWQKTEVRHQKRLAKVQELLSSEEEKKKKKHRQKSQEQHKMSHSPQQLPQTQQHQHQHQHQHQQQQAHQQLQNQKHQQPLLVSNGKSPERSESPNSTSTATSAGTVTPPCGINENIPPPPLPVLLASAHGQSSVSAPDSSMPVAPGRSALLDSICSFNKSALRHTNTKELVKTSGRVCP
ncbi:PX domain-containing protein kinase-like protein [Gryllus bimaculatus]|nr:PX domain-containing protein kinase-like protein [Gryllus bimaculatus]